MSVHGFTVYDVIERGASLFGDAPAVIQNERSLSFREFKDRVDALAAGLAGLGMTKGDRICVLAQNDVAYLTLYGACARQGVIAYPINWRLTGEEVERVVERAAPKMMVVDGSTLGVVAGWPESKKAIEHWYQFGGSGGAGLKPFDSIAGGARVTAPADVSPADPFAVISTAAVDVIPRGAVLTHANVVTANLTAMACLGLSATDHYLLALPLFHITGLGMALAHMHAGATNVVVPRFDAEEAVRLIDRHRITHISDFPPVLANLLDAAKKLGRGLPSLKHVSGLDAPPTIQRLHEETRAQFWTGFGQSETSGFVSLQRVADRPGAAGKPVPLCQIKVVDDYDREVPVGTPGEIVVRGPLVFQGYFDQPDVTAYTFRNGWHHTGDVGRFDADGYLHYVRRKPEKELIKPGGENVYPAEVETVIMQMDGVSGVCVYGIPDARWGEAIKAVVEVKRAGQYSAQQVSDFVASKIARFKRPHVVVFADALARTADGSVDREAVKSKWGSGA
ncbi:MAG TPA: AMP-binding protein [Methylomirabilota bacterium]|jgi:long-chain acyl-CoA synthetase|nr:AMP-binding protein [Methylomirabilota bacterium]